MYNKETTKKMKREISKYSRKKKYGSNSSVVKIISSILILIVLVIACLQFGKLIGDIIYEYDSKLISQVNEDNFKSLFNISIPLIHTVYNSGNIDFSIISEVSNIIETLFGFNLNKPSTILQSSNGLFAMYNNINGIAITDTPKNDKANPPSPIQQEQPSPSSDTMQDNNNTIVDEEKIPAKNDDEPEIEDETKDIKEDASSISWPPEDMQEESTQYNKILIYDETNSGITKKDIENMLNQPLKIKFDLKKSGPKIFVYHTHTSESYVLKNSDIGKQDVPSTNPDPRYNIVRVGDELSKILNKKYGIETIHNGTVHDYPDHSTAYSRSAITLAKYLKSYPSIKMSIDVHRDGIFGKKLRVVAEKDGKKCAKIMFVVGSDARFNHPEWKKNLQLAIKLQDKLNTIYPGITKPIYISKNRYNQHMAGLGITVEVGGDGNTLEEAIESVKYLAQAINEVIK